MAERETVPSVLRRDSYRFTAILQIRPVHVKVLSVVNYQSVSLTNRCILYSGVLAKHLSKLFIFTSSLKNEMAIYPTPKQVFIFCKMSLNNGQLKFTVVSFG